MTMNINNIKKNDRKVSNYRLLGQPTKLVTRIHHAYVVPDGDGYALAGGVSPNFEEVTTEELHESLMRVRGARKQRAAKAYVPKESIKVVPLTKPAPVAVAVARFEGTTVEQAKVSLQVADLERQIREVEKLLGLREKFEERRNR